MSGFRLRRRSSPAYGPGVAGAGLGCLNERFALEIPFSDVAAGGRKLKEVFAGADFRSPCNRASNSRGWHSAYSAGHFWAILRVRGVWAVCRHSEYSAGHFRVQPKGYWRVGAMLSQCTQCASFLGPP